MSWRVYLLAQYYSIKETFHAENEDRLELPTNGALAGLHFSPHTSA